MANNFPTRTVKDVLFNKAFQDSDGKCTSGVNISLVTVAGSYTDREGKEVPYSKEKIDVVVSKLDHKTGEVLHKAKEGKNGPYAVKDENRVTLEIDQLKEILFSADEIMEKI